MSSPARPLWHGRALALVGIVLFAFSLRMAVASLSPVLDHITKDFPVPPTVIGLIGTAPPVCYAVFGILTPRLERLLGLERLTLVAIACVTIGLVWRAFATDALTLLLSTAVIFAGVGVGNVLLPPLVKSYFSDRVGLMTTAYSTAMAIATFLPPLVAVPVTDAAGWHVSLGLWTVFSLAAAIPWLALLRHTERPAAADVESASPRVFGRLWRLPMTWAITIAFAVSSTIAYTTFGWLPVILLDVAHVTPAAAGSLLSLYALIGMPCSLVVPLLVVRFHVVRPVFWVAIVVGIVGLGGLLLWPTTVTWLWVILYGLTGALFPLALVLLGLRARTHEGSVALSGFVQSIGYAIAAVFPFAVGVIHDLTDGWTVSLCLLVVVLLIAIPAALVASRPRTVEDEWERRHGAW